MTNLVSVIKVVLDLIDREEWPHGGKGPAMAHGAIFWPSILIGKINLVMTQGTVVETNWLLFKCSISRLPRRSV